MESLDRYGKKLRSYTALASLTTRDFIMARPSYMAVDLAALIDNYQWACSLAPKSQTMAVVKANAYGHGATRCAIALQPYAPIFGVACIEEALALRKAGIHKPIVLLEGVAPHKSWQTWWPTS